MGCTGSGVRGGGGGGLGMVVPVLILVLLLVVEVTSCGGEGVTPTISSDICKSSVSLKYS